MVVDGALQLTLGPFHHEIAALNLAFPLSQARRQFLSISFLYDIYHHRTSINFNHHFQFNSVLNTRSHHLSLFPLQSSINCHQYSFFVNAVFLWNSTPWNSIPWHIINDSNPKSFQHSPFQCLCDHYISESSVSHINGV